MDRRVGGVLIVAAFVLALAGLMLWTQATKNAEDEQLANEYARALGADFDDPEPNRTPALACFAIAGLATICGTIVLSRDRPVEEQQPQGPPPT